MLARSTAREGRRVTSTAEKTRTPGRPRSEKAHKAILTAAMELLFDQGLHTMSIDEVARRAGVSKATIYRWWPSNERLALDALATEWASTPPASQRDTGSLRGDLLTRFRPWIRQLNRKPYARVVAGLVAEAQTNRDFAELYRSHFVQARRDATRELLVRAGDRGEIAAKTDLEVTLDLLYGPIYHRLLHTATPPHRTIRPASHRLRHRRNIRERTHRIAIKLCRPPARDC
jgi:AcrR family transcriptional regulator